MPPWIVHVSDLHLLASPREQETILRSLVHALRAERTRRGAAPRLIALTGDVFESCTLPPDVAVPAFRALLDEMHGALGEPVPTVIVPGNHDRRRAGLFLPHDESLFDALREALAGRSWVLGRDRPFLAEVVPHEVHRLPLWIVAYDSNHLPTGAIGAGGAIRQEDLLRAAAIIDGHRPEWPVLFLLHHHLIPTPLTDLGPIDVEEGPRAVRWLVERGLPTLLANADREELFMTALGAGTALSTLHAMGRAVVVLHGHKHYATSRLLKATRADHGDVLIVSAGSAGTAQQWRPGAQRETARLWPSFNTLTLAADRVVVEQVAFSWREVSEELARRPMVSLQRAQSRLHPTHLDEAPLEPGPRLAQNDAHVSLWPSARFGDHRWDTATLRRVRFAPGSEDARYVETIEAPPGSGFQAGCGAERVTSGDAAAAPQVALDARGDARFVVSGGLARSVAEARRLEGSQATPFSRVHLMNRYQCARATLTVSGLGPRARSAFGSITDLGTGLESPRPIVVDDAAGQASLQVDACAPRTLLRIYWLADDPSLPQARGEVPAAAASVPAPALRLVSG